MGARAKQGTDVAGARGPKGSSMQCRAIESGMIDYCTYCYLSGNKCEKLVRYLEEKMK